jgi:hypothetical protein
MPIRAFSHETFLAIKREGCCLVFISYPIISERGVGGEETDCIDLHIVPCLIVLMIRGYRIKGKRVANWKWRRNCR